VWEKQSQYRHFVSKDSCRLLRFLALPIVAVRDWRALAPTRQRLGVVVLLLDELGLRLVQEECPAYCRSRRSEEWRDRMPQKGRPLDSEWRFRWCGRGSGEHGRIVWKVR
jgi:hypothetical protein